MCPACWGSGRAWVCHRGHMAPGIPAPFTEACPASGPQDCQASLALLGLSPALSALQSWGSPPPHQHGSAVPGPGCGPTGPVLCSFQEDGFSIAFTAQAMPSALPHLQMLGFWGHQQRAFLLLPRATPPPEPSQDSRSPRQPAGMGKEAGKDVWWGQDFSAHRGAMG